MTDMSKFEEIKQHGLTEQQWLEMAQEMAVSQTAVEQCALAMVLFHYYSVNYNVALTKIRRFRSLPEMWSVIANVLKMTPENLRNLAAAEITQRMADALDCDVEEIFEPYETPLLPPKSKRGKPS